MLRQGFKVQTLSAPKLLGQILHTIFNQSHCHHPSIYQLSSTHYCYHPSNFEGEGEKEFLNAFLCGHLALFVNLKLLGLLPQVAWQIHSKRVVYFVGFYFTHNYFISFFFKTHNCSTFAFSFSILRFLKSGK